MGLKLLYVMADDDTFSSLYLADLTFITAPKIIISHLFQLIWFSQYCSSPPPKATPYLSPHWRRLLDEAASNKGITAR